MIPPNREIPGSNNGKPRKSRVRYDIPDDIRSKDLSRIEFLKYIFGDFIKGMYIIGCLFLDALIVPPSFLSLPGFGSYSGGIALLFGGLNIYSYYYLTLLVLTEFLLVLLQIYFYAAKIRVKMQIGSFQKYRVR